MIVLASVALGFIVGMISDAIGANRIHAIAFYSIGFFQSVAIMYIVEASK